MGGIFLEGISDFPLFEIKYKRFPEMNKASVLPIDSKFIPFAFRIDRECDFRVKRR